MKNIKEFLVPTLVLFLICLIAAALLGVTNDVTAPVIEANAAKASAAAMKEVLPDADKFGDTAENEFGVYAPAYGKDGEIAGYAVTAEGKGGYNGTVKLMVGIDSEGKVKNISFLEIDETPSIGGKIPKNESFLSQFTGLFGSAALTKNGGTVDAVSGATKTSTAVTDAVNNALLCYEEVRANG
ncbi:MAG: RnfABCDGE type electron transport complex subunit G [Clostridia bacterium]|nr:RnfABCDGE type electron transport complex subunit G [Clostridia bacterium]